MWKGAHGISRHGQNAEQCLMKTRGHFNTVAAFCSFILVKMSKLNVEVIFNCKIGSTIKGIELVKTDSYSREVRFCSENPQKNKRQIMERCYTPRQCVSDTLCD